jgi:hypothetical protein
LFEKVFKCENINKIIRLIPTVLHHNQSIDNSIMASFIYIAIVISVVALFGACSALQCFQCGQYNDGVGSITPCLNYSAALAHLHLKDCGRGSDKF